MRARLTCLLLFALCGSAPASAADTRWSGSMVSGAAMSFDVGSGGRVHDLDVAWVRTVCSDGVDHAPRLISSGLGPTIDRSGRFQGTIALRTPPGSATIRGRINGAVATGTVRAHFTESGASCDSGTGAFTARRAGGGSTQPPPKPAKGAAVARSFAKGVKSLVAALGRFAAISPDLSPAAGSRAMQSAGRAINRVALAARRAVNRSRAATSRQRRGRTQALAGFLAYARAGADLASAGRYLVVDEVRGERFLERGIKRMQTGRAALRRAGRLLGVSTSALPGG